MAPRSLIWTFFTKQDLNGEKNQSAMCNVCKSVIKMSQCTTSSLRRHLNIHPLEQNKLIAAELERNNSMPPAGKRQRNESGSQPSLRETIEKTAKFGINSPQQMAFDEALVDMMATTGTAFNWIQVEQTNIKYSLT